METLRRLVRYNGWANRRVFACCQAVDPTALGAQAKGTAGTVEETLKHLVEVEDVYLAMLRDQELDASGSTEQSMARDLAWFAARVTTLAEEYGALLDEVDEPFLERELKVPWFDRPLTKRDGLIQAITHSTQHRAQVLSALGARGVETPGVDYVWMLQEG